MSTTVKRFPVRYYVKTFLCFCNPLFLSLFCTEPPPSLAYSRRLHPSRRCEAVGRALVWSSSPGTAPPSVPGPHPAVAARSQCGPWSCCGESCCWKWPSLCWIEVTYRQIRGTVDSFYQMFEETCLRRKTSILNVMFFGLLFYEAR